MKFRKLELQSFEPPKRASGNIPPEMHCISPMDVPSLGALQQYNVNRPNAIEVIRSSLYDTLAYAQAGQTQLKFFQTPQGQGGKTLADTNMQAAGALASPQSFLVQTIELFFYPNASIVPAVTGGTTAPAYVNDTSKFYRYGGWLDFFIGSKSYLDEAPLQKFPPRNGLSGFAALSDATTAGSTQLTSVTYASAAGPVYEINPPILLTPTQNFNVSLNWPTAIALSAAATVICTMSGYLYRNSQ